MGQGSTFRRKWPILNMELRNNIHPDLQRERARATFPIIELTNIIDDGQEKTERRRYIQNLVIADPRLVSKGYHFLDRDGLLNDGMRRYALLRRRAKELNLTDPSDLMCLERTTFPNEEYPCIVHDVMFMDTLNTLASDEQRDTWLEKARHYEMIGTYAQTELGHGSHLKGLETTATFDESTDEIIIHSPTLTSAKFWPGNLGKTANVAVVVAQLYSKGIHRGINFFLVPLRDPVTHTPLPGVTVGDIGPKFGFNMTDNGFARFDQVRIPRTNMMMRQALLFRDGSYSRPRGGSAKLAYATMTKVRTGFTLHYAAIPLAKVCVIAIRYSAVRRQSHLSPDTHRESQIMDYQTQQEKLFTALSAAYAFMFAAQHLQKLHSHLSGQVTEGTIDMESLKHLHVLSSGLKAFLSEHACKDIEVCRQACGGHGFSQSSGIPKIYVSAVVACTGEGENTILYLQVARFLVESVARATRGEILKGSFGYLNDSSDTCRITGEPHLEAMLASFKHRARELVRAVCARLATMVAKGLPEYEAWNLSSVALVKAAKAHMQMYILENFVHTIDQAEPSRSVRKVLTDLCLLYGSHHIELSSGDLLVNGFMNSRQLGVILQKKRDLLTEIRPNAVALADAFDFPDEVLQSVLGRYDGWVYEHLYRWPQESPLNDTDVNDASRKYIREMRKSKL